MVTALLSVTLNHGKSQGIINSHVETMRLIFMGTPDFAVPTLIELAGAGHAIAAVYTRAPKPAGRGMDLQETPVAREAARAFPDSAECQGRFGVLAMEAAPEEAEAALRAAVALGEAGEQVVMGLCNLLQRQDRHDAVFMNAGS